MKSNRNTTRISILFLTILIALFSSCNDKNRSNYTNQDITTADSVETRIDTTRWLKPTKGIRCIFEDSKGNIWFSSTDFVCVFDGSEITYFKEEDGLCGIGRVQEDKNGIIWIETGDEICSYDGVEFSTHHLEPNESIKPSSSSPDDLWFNKGLKTEGPPGVYRYHEDKITFLPFPVPTSEDSRLLYLGSTGAIQGKDEVIWFGTMEAVFGLKNGEFTIIDREEMGRQNDKNNIGIRGLHFDSKGNLWIADNGSGVFVYDGDTTINFTKIHQLDHGDTDGNTLHRAFSIAEDDMGNMWFGTVYSGIWRYDGKSFANFTKEDGVKSDVIWTIYKTKKGELLFAGEDPGGVYKFNGTSFDRVY